MADQQPTDKSKSEKPKKSAGELAWEEAQKDIPRHDAEFEAKHGNGGQQ